MEEIVQRLSERFPDTPAPEITQAVSDARRRFDRAKIRDFVPVLIEREARARLERPLN
ncbi:three-helix bundle dimerization domain-containing protein [Microbacterium sp. 179-I 1D1 NHS]|uniref:three-helix bundle dimerization domain-containing protein n=1 Tax=Microbacterium sp. 179-I 1D1 NHS TaxID=3374298 RepID=UPI003879E529